MAYLMDLPVLSNVNVDIVLITLGVWLVYKITQTLRSRARFSTHLRGPFASNWLFGTSEEITSGDSAALYEEWADKYGSVFQVPMAMGSCRVVLCDPTAIAHFYSLETFGYVNSSAQKIELELIVGKGILWADGESHRRQRKALTPAFSNASIRALTPTFYDSGYKVKAAWDSLIHVDSTNEAIIDVQSWMNRVSLDTIGIAGFSHNFGTLEGKQSTIADIFNDFGSRKRSTMSTIISNLAHSFPFLFLLPSNSKRNMDKLRTNTAGIAELLLGRTRTESEVDKSYAGRSIIEILVKAENANSTQIRITEDEVRAQMQALIVAGYETTSISLTWALIELSRYPEKQQRLREELEQFNTSDPTYEQLTNGLPFLGAVVQETLRLHPPAVETTRVAAADDVIPLSVPIMMNNGQTIDRVTITAGTQVTVPIGCMNRCTRIWGPDAKLFVPERWIDDAGLTPKAKEIHGYRHILTFVDGPRTCLGKAFAVTEFKSVLSVLIRNYSFSLRDGPDTKIEMMRSLLPLARPKVAGEEGTRLPLRVRQLG